MVNGFGFCCCERGEERTILPFLSNRLDTGSELLFAVCDPTNGRDRRLVEDDFSNLDAWLVNGGATASGGTVQFPGGGSISQSRVLAISTSHQSMTMRIVAGSNMGSATGGTLRLNTSEVGDFTGGFDSFVVSSSDANPWNTGDVLEIRVVQVSNGGPPNGGPPMFEYYVNGSLMTSEQLVGTGPTGCIFITCSIQGDDSASYTDFSLEVFGP